MIDYTANMSFVDSDNVDTYDVYINDDFYGTNVPKIQITTNDILRIQVVKLDGTKESQIRFENKLV